MKLWVLSLGLLLGLLYAAVSEQSGRCDYYYRPSYHAQVAPIISLSLDPQESLNCDLRIAAREGNMSRSLHLIAQGANINGVSDVGQSALMYAAETCNVQVGRMLLSKGARPDLRDKYGRTALMLASRGSCSELIFTMTGLPGSDIRARDKSGRSALDYANEAASLYEEGPPLDSVRFLRRGLSSLHLHHQHSKDFHRLVSASAKQF